MRLASQADFYGGIYAHYRHHEGYAKRARLFKFYPEPLLVVGCGFGFLVEEFDNLGIVAWGIDASDYAIRKSTHPRVRKFDILHLNDWSLGQFGTVITEDLLPCLTDAEVLIATRNCQAIAPIVIHMVTEQGQADLNYHSLTEWILLTSQLTVSLEGM